MRRSILGLVAFVALSGGSVFGQELAGNWQGTLTTPAAQNRVVARITKTPDGKFEGRIFPIDQGSSAGLPVTSISVDGRNVKWRVDGIAAAYEGNFAADGNAINGALTQPTNVATLNLVRATPQNAWAIPEPPPASRPMDPAADPGIEVATVKPSAVEGRGRGLGFEGTQMRVVNYTLLHAITFAYEVHERQVTGGPSWISSDRFEIVVKADTPGQPNPQQIRRLLQKVLTERFQLKFHREKQELSVYAITQPANLKHKLTASASQENLPTLRFPRPGLLPARNATVAGLAQTLQGSVLDRPVVNLTNIEGRYDFTLDWTPDEFQFTSNGAPPRIPDTGMPNIYQAFQEQLGLKLEATKAPVDVIVIERAEKPSAN